MTYERSLLASDMDGTVIPLDESPGREEEVAELRAALEREESLILAYVTGRDFALARKGIRDYDLPAPDLLVCDVGTSLFHRTTGGFEMDGGYASRMQEALGAVDMPRIREKLEGIPGLHLQPGERQSDFKLSYYLDPDADHGEIVRRTGESLEDVGGEVQIIHSIRARDGTGLLDLLPAGVAKDYAIRYLHDHTGVDEDRLVYAGDSGNDLAAMLSGFKVVVVGNAPEELKEELRRKGRERDILSSLYFARHPFARGVLEGCRHFGIL